MQDFIKTHSFVIAIAIIYATYIYDSTGNLRRVGEAAGSLILYLSIAYLWSLTFPKKEGDPE